jgi:hypothetical protein
MPLRCHTNPKTVVGAKTAASLIDRKVVLRFHDRPIDEEDYFIMARYSGPVCKLCRREGMKLFLKGKVHQQQIVPLSKRAMLRPTWTFTKNKDVRIFDPIAREAKSQKHVWIAGKSVR